jgi:hypothetical protein
MCVGSEIGIRFVFLKAISILFNAAQQPFPLHS